ncbi:class I adenylate-forming enzyme family protein [Zooshikella harenae]|uniref:Long-chain fatty acid--CoA ligase n=1 Tax=Zooshikella harenae TaxID=2827238 RepID=A0ABS5ZHA1_9GAMM|nr:fatty acid--CoA ligase family protein [Zooshikella harenae]MBU2713436.1 long-chain fatty acid--CoA ligase [Zooshikella harenae]
MSSVYQRVKSTAETYANHTAICVAGQLVSYEALLNQVHYRVRWLQSQGVCPTHRLLVTESDTYQLIVLELAASYLGLTLIYLEGLVKARHHELNAIVSDAAADWLIEDSNGTDVVFPQQFRLTLPDVENQKDVHLDASFCVKQKTDNVLVQAYTSGTTGKPKGVCLSDYRLCSQGQSVAKAMQIHAQARILLDDSIIDLKGQLLMLAGFSQGACLVINDVPDDQQVFAVAAEYGISHMMLPPFYLAEALKDSELESRNLSALELIAYGCAPIDQTLLQRAQRILSCRWLQGYGLTETAGPFCWLANDDHEQGRGTVGKPAKGVTLKLTDRAGNPSQPGQVGEIWVQSPGNMLGYWDAEHGQPVASEEIIQQDWLKTGDMGVLTSEGFLQLKGRLRDIVLLADGFTVYTREIEETILSLNLLDDVAVAAWQDNEQGEVPLVFMRSTQNILSMLPKIQQHLLTALSPLKHPKYAYIYNKPFPRGRNGKIQKHELVDDVKQQQLIPLFI